MNTVADTPADVWQTLEVTATLDDNPAYAGSSHDDATARRLGFRAALIPGAFVYGYASRIAVEAWGMDWVTRGTMGARFRRPVFNGDELLVSAGTPVRDSAGQRSEITVSNSDGEAVFVGWIGLPDAASTPPAASGLPVLPPPDPPIPIAPGAMKVGTLVGTRNAILSPQDVAVSLAAFGENHPIYARENIVHSGMLIRLTMGDTLRSFKLPSPPIFVSSDTQHYQPLHPGRRMSTSGRVTAAYERKGKFYFDVDEYLIADGVDVVARFSRVQLYAMGDS